MNKKFRKVIAAASAVAMIGTVGLVPVTASAADSTVIYERGTTTAWSDADIAEWVVSGDATTKPTINADHGLYADCNQTGYVTKTFSVSDSAVVTYDVDFYTASSTGRENNYAYVKFGSDVTVGYNSNYCMYYSTDGGVKYNATALTGNINNKTTNIKAVINTSSNTLISLTVGGTDVASAANTALSDATYNSISMGFVREGSVSWNTQYGLKKVNISEVVDETIYRHVTFDVEGVQTYASVSNNASIEDKNIPQTNKTAHIFKGWAVNGDKTNLLSTADLKTYKITADTIFTAVYEADASYIEPIVEASITGPSSMTFGPDPDTAASNDYTLTLKGETGTIITAENINSSIRDFNITWDVEGFKTENDKDGQYCDSYGAFAEHTSTATNVSFMLRQAAFNFYGRLTANITYNGQKLKASIPVVAIGDKSMESNQILPEAGYPSDFDIYPDALVGYKTIAETYGGEDIVVGGWDMAGSDAGREAVITEENGNKFIRINATTVKKSHVLTNSISTPSAQVIFEQNIRFNSNNGVITLTAGYPFWSSASSYGNPLTLSYSGSALSLNNTELTLNDTLVKFNQSTWYKVILSFDKTTSSCYAIVYDENGDKLAEAKNVPLADASNPTYYSVGLNNNGTGSIDFDCYKAYYPSADGNKYTLTATQDTLSIPNGDTAELTAALMSAEGYEMTGAATWKVLEEDMQGVIVTPDAADPHKAVVTLGAEAVAGTATVQVNIGGYTKSIELTITSSAESVKFTKSTASISVPLDASSVSTAYYAATVVDGKGTEIGGRNVTYELYDKTNINAYTPGTGITFNAADVTLTVTSEAKPATFVVRATSTNTDGETISRAVRVTVHGLSFDLGSGETGSVVEGYTDVSASTNYTDSLGFGIEGNVAAGGIASDSDVTSDYLEGSFVFKAKVTPGYVYKTTINFAGDLATEYHNNVIVAHKRTLDASSTQYTGYTIKSAEIAQQVYNIPVVDDVLDLHFTNAKVASITVERVVKSATPKPNIYSIGDSTLGNNGSYGYVLARDQKNYPELTKLIESYHNNGKGSRTLKSYVEEGWLDGVLASINPGDIVTIGNMGTNTGGLSGNQFKAPLDYYVDACLTMGAKVILTSYTPDGGVEYYDVATHKFNGKRTGAYDSQGIRVIKEERSNDPNVLGFIDIGLDADNIFNTYVADYAKNGYADEDEAAKAIYTAFVDHNHYSGLATELMLNGYGEAKGIVAQLVDILSNWDVKVGTIKTATAENGTFATGWMPTITNVSKAGQSINTINIAVTSDNETKTFTAKSGKDFNNIVLDANGAVKLIVIVEGIADENASLKLDVE